MTRSILPEKEKTIQITLFTALLMDGFWDRWRAHGVEEMAIKQVRAKLTKLEHWISVWERNAVRHEQIAGALEAEEKLDEAEYHYRLAGLYYYLNQWIYPEREEAKQHWFGKCLDLFRYADGLSPIKTTYDAIMIDGHDCFGRIRVPENPAGCIVIINPFDSSKEELFTYEQDFIQGNFVTISFDGPGQGETYTFSGLKGSRKRWMEFVDQLIDYASSFFSDLPLYLFGTSSGGAWAVYGSANPKVSKAVSVSPAVKIGVLPDFFKERMNVATESNEIILPDFEVMEFKNPVFVFHGRKDVMVSQQDVSGLFARLPDGKRYMEFMDEGHCCNFRLNEIRKISMNWYLDKRG